jgi:hypothetical protein
LRRAQRQLLQQRIQLLRTRHVTQQQPIKLLRTLQRSAAAAAAAAAAIAALLLLQG